MNKFETLLCCFLLFHGRSSSLVVKNPKMWSFFRVVPALLRAVRNRWKRQLHLGCVSSLLWLGIVRKTLFSGGASLKMFHKQSKREDELGCPQRCASKRMAAPRSPVEKKRLCGTNTADVYSLIDGLCGPVF